MQRTREIWRYNGERVEFLKRSRDGSYSPIAVSAALPMLTPSIINEHLKMLETAGDTTVMRTFRDWLRTLPEAT